MKKAKRIKTCTSQLKNIDTKENSFLDSQMQLNFCKKIKTQTDIPSSKSANSGMELYFMKTKRLKLFPKSKATLRQKNLGQQTNRFNFQTNFQILKKQIQNLENDNTFLRITTEPQKNNPQSEFDNSAIYNNYIVNSQFVSSKKTALLQKHRQNIKLVNKNRKLNLVLQPHKQKQPDQKKTDIELFKKIDVEALKSSFLSFQITNEQIFLNKGLKKRQTPQIVKKYFKCFNQKHQKSFSKSNFNSTTSQIKGKGFSCYQSQKQILQNKKNKKRSLSVLNKRQQIANDQAKDQQTYFIYL